MQMLNADYNKISSSFKWGKKTTQWIEAVRWLALATGCYGYSFADMFV